MKIAVVTVSRGMHVRVYVEYLIAAGHDVTVFTNGTRYLDTDVRTVDLRPFSGHRFRLPQQLIDTLRANRLTRGLESGGFDVVNCQMVMLDALTALEVSPAPVVLSFHGSDLHRRDELADDFSDRLEKLLPRAAAIHAVSEHMAAELVGLGAAREKVAVFQYGIDPDRFVPRAPAPRRHCIISGRALKPLYRVHLIVEAMPAVLAAVPDAELAIYDRGPEESRLVQLAADLGVASKIRFCGHRPQDTIAEDLGKDAVWVSAAETDGTPLSLLEAMAAGAVPVVTDLPTLHEWLEPGRGVFVEPTPQGIAAGVIEGLRIADAGTHAAENRALVVERANRATNLERYERLLADAAAAGAPTAR